MSKRKTVAELETELRLLRRHNRIDAFASVANTFIRWAGLVGIAYFVYLSIAAMAGQQTVAALVVDIVAKVGIGKWLAYAVGAGGLTYGWKQRNVRRDTIERLQARITALERAIDPRRSSSQLTARGETPPEDLR